MTTHKNKDTFERGVNSFVLIVAVFCGIATIGSLFSSVPWHWFSLGALAYLFVSKVNQHLGFISAKAEMEQQQPTAPAAEEKKVEEKATTANRRNVDIPVP